MVWIYKKHKNVNIPIRFKDRWVDLSTDKNNITKRSRNIYKVTKQINYETGKFTGRFNLSFLKTEYRKENLKTKGNHHKLAPIQKAIFRQVVLALRKKTTIKIIAKAFHVSTRTIWKIKGKTIFFCKVNVTRLAWSMSEWFNAYNMKQITDISINEIMNGAEPD